MRELKTHLLIEAIGNEKNSFQKYFLRKKGYPA